MIVLVFAVSVQREVGVWRQAADLRDHVLADARRHSTGPDNMQAAFTSVPKPVSGAYVLPNGFPEALRRRGNEPRGGITRVHVHSVDGRFSAVEVSPHLPSL